MHRRSGTILPASRPPGAEGRGAVRLAAASAALAALLAGCAQGPGEAWRRPGDGTVRKAASLAAGAGKEPASAAPAAGAPPAGPPLPDAKLRYSFEECRGECIRVLLESDDDHPFVSDYLKAVAKRITVNLAFPWESIQRGPEGDVGIRFRIDRKGQLVSKEILKSSGVRVLDDTALDSIVKGAPFSPFPPSPYIAGIGVRADFRFRP